MSLQVKQSRSWSINIWKGVHIKSTAKIDSAATNSLFYIDDNSELKTLGIGTTDEYFCGIFMEWN